MVLAPKKSVTIQAGWRLLPGVTPVSRESGAGVTSSSAGQAPPVVVPVPSSGHVDAEAEGAPSKVAEQLAMEVIPLPTLGQTELPLVTVASTVVGATPPVEAPPTQVEVAAIVTSPS